MLPVTKRFMSLHSWGGTSPLIFCKSWFFAYIIRKIIKLLFTIISFNWNQELLHFLALLKEFFNKKFLNTHILEGWSTCMIQYHIKNTDVHKAKRMFYHLKMTETSSHLKVKRKFSCTWIMLGCKLNVLFVQIFFLITYNLRVLHQQYTTHPPFIF